VHGHALTPDQRVAFFQHLDRHAESVAVTVICQRRNAIGGWGMGALEEYILRSEMIIEACEILSRTDLFQKWAATTSSIGLTKDGGRYPKSVRDLAKEKVAFGLQQRVASFNFAIQYGDSCSTPGLQIADIIGNTVFKLHGHDGKGIIAELIEPKRESRSLQLVPVQLKGIRPAWRETNENEEAAMMAAC
jgi:hypothetical protein